MKIHKRLIDLESPAEVVKQIVSRRKPSLPPTNAELTHLALYQTSMSIESGVEVEVTIAA